MKVCYNNLFKLLIDKKMKKTDLAREAGLTPATLARLSKDEIVSMETIIKICECLNCRIEDVLEIVKDQR
ncbi:helix-turn-helix domain-containing protein [Bulleidia sp. HCP3S3_G12]|uniref:helix-turn-helix domain-containing protein n=1 Tax=Bulleidia sp. HCP3S3_G12 TaxID=3438916 RepID=UPI003F8AF190